MKIQRFLLVPLLLLVAACAREPYPYPPQYVASEEISPRVLPQPPLPYSKKYNQEIETIIEEQKDLSDVDRRVIKEESHITPEMIVVPVLGEKYSEERYPALYTLLKHAASDTWRIGDRVQDYWHSPRPWYADGRVELVVPSITRPGYPSGHTSTNTVWAYILGDLFPAKRAALMDRATKIGYHRVMGGAHFPHDVAGGKMLAKAVFTKMKTKRAYKKEFAAARYELKHPRALKSKNSATSTHKKKRVKTVKKMDSSATPELSPLRYHFLTP